MQKLIIVLLCFPMMVLGQNVYIPDANFKIYPVSGYGSPELVRYMIQFLIHLVFLEYVAIKK